MYLRNELISLTRFHRLLIVDIFLWVFVNQSIESATIVILKLWAEMPSARSAQRKKKYNRNQQQQQNGRKSRIKATKAMTNGTEKQMTNGDGVFLHRCCSHHFS